MNKHISKRCARGRVSHSAPSNPEGSRPTNRLALWNRPSGVGGSIGNACGTWTITRVGSKNAPLNALTADLREVIRHAAYASQAPSNHGFGIEGPLLKASAASLPAATLPQLVPPRAGLLPQHVRFQRSIQPTKRRVLWRLSDAGPGGCGKLRHGPASESRHRSTTSVGEAGGYSA